jgi:hypothetical protein
MKNKILKISLLSIILLSMNAFSQNSEMDELENLGDYFSKINNSPELLVTPKVEPEEIEMSQPSLTKNNKVESTTFINQDIPVFSVTTEEEPIKKESPALSLGDGSFDKVFMKSVPEGTRFTVKRDFVLLPKQKYIIFHNGEKVIDNPQVTNPLTTFCFIEFTNSGKARILKEGRNFTVTKNDTTLDLYQSNDGISDREVKVYQSNLSVNVKSIRAFKCYKAAQKSENPLPLRIKDLRDQTGSSFSIEFPAYEEI